MQNAPSARVRARRLRLVRDRRPRELLGGRLRARRAASSRPPGSCSSAHGVDTGCGAASAQTGPFYCPPTSRSTSTSASSASSPAASTPPATSRRPTCSPTSTATTSRRSPRITQQVDTASRENPDQRNALSVRVELQADCLAGVWAHSTFERGLLERGRPRGGPDRRRVGRRRPHPGRDDRSDQPRDVHARHRGAARGLVQARLRRRRRDRLRHLLRRHLTATVTSP